MTSHLLPTYARVDLAFERGEGAWLFATNGDRYLDFTSGVAVNALGHAHPRLVAALDRAGAEGLARLQPLSRFRKPNAWPSGCAKRASPTASSSAIPAPRRWNARSRWRANITSPTAIPERYRIITFEGAFHGRTLATLAATGQKKYLEGFGPAVEGFDQVPFDDLDAVKARDRPARPPRSLIEPIMGEGGVRVVEPAFLRALRELCDQHGLLLIFDEVQTGMGRTGELFAYQRTGVEPDIMALAKALGGGFPVGRVPGDGGGRPRA